MLDSDFRVVDTISADSVEVGDLIAIDGEVYEVRDITDQTEDIIFHSVNLFGEVMHPAVGAWDDVELVTYA